MNLACLPGLLEMPGEMRMNIAIIRQRMPEIILGVLFVTLQQGGVGILKGPP